MKRVVLLTISLMIILCTFTGCLAIPKYKNYEISKDTVSSIEIYDLRDADTLYSNFLKTVTPAYAISEEKVNDFLNDLSKIEFSDVVIITIAAVDPSFYYDVWTVRINYTDGSYELVSCDGFGETYDKNDEVTSWHHYGCDQDEWNVLIKKYVPQSILDESL